MERLNNDNYNRPKVTKQDLISENNDELKNKLKNWVLMPEDYLDRIKCGIWIRYVSHQGLYRSGGILINNSSPTYLVLLNPKLNKTWSVNLANNYIFIEDIEKKKKVEKIKNDLYELYQKGMLDVKSENDN